MVVVPNIILIHKYYPRTGLGSQEPISIPGLLMKTAREVELVHITYLTLLEVELEHITYLTLLETLNVSPVTNAFDESKSPESTYCGNENQGTKNWGRGEYFFCEINL